MFTLQYHGVCNIYYRLFKIIYITVAGAGGSVSRPAGTAGRLRKQTNKLTYMDKSLLKTRAYLLYS